MSSIPCHANARRSRLNAARQMMERGVVHGAQRCDARDMAADGRTKGSIDRDMLLQVMDGMQSSK
eukprot:7000335-Pyramimonas_sp.AAC.1